MLKVGIEENNKMQETIKFMFSCHDGCWMFYPSRSNRVQTPGDTNTSRWTETSMDSIGTKNSIIARLLMQSELMLNKIGVESELAKNIRTILFECTEALLLCLNIFKEINLKIEQSIIEISEKGVHIGKYNINMISSFPRIRNLTKDCGSFLYHANDVVKGVCELASNLFGLGKTHNNFAYLISTIKEKFNVGEKDNLIDFLSGNSENIKRIIGLRNGYDHLRTTAQKTIILDFRLIGNDKIVEPQWYLEKDGQPLFDPSSIREEMDGIIHFLLEVTEHVFMYFILENIDHDYQYIEEIPEEIREQDAPIRFNLAFDINKLGEKYKVDLTKS